MSDTSRIAALRSTYSRLTSPGRKREGMQYKFVNIKYATVLEFAWDAIGALPWASREFVEDRSADSVRNIFENALYLYLINPRFTVHSLCLANNPVQRRAAQWTVRCNRLLVRSSCPGGGFNPGVPHDRSDPS